MKKAILLIFFLISLKVSAQQTFWTTGVPPGSTSFSPTFRFLGTDSLANVYFSNGSKWWLGYTATQSNLRFLRKADSLHFVTPYYFNHHQGIVQKAYIDSLNAAIFSQGHTYTAEQFFNAGIYLNGTNLDMAGGIVTNAQQLVVKDGNGAIYTIQKFPGTMQMGTPKYGFVIDSATNLMYTSGSSGHGGGIPYVIGSGTSLQYIKGDGTFGTYAAGSGTVTSITPGVGFTSHTPITASGTMDVDTAFIHGLSQPQITTLASRIATNTTNITANNTAIGIRQLKLITALPTPTGNRPIVGDSIVMAVEKNVKRADSLAAAIGANTTAIGLRAIKDSTYNINKNLYDVLSKSTARSNLDVYSTAQTNAAIATVASTIPVGGNPTATAGLNAVNGTSLAWMRADAAPKVDSTVFKTNASATTDRNNLITRINVYTPSSTNVVTNKDLSSGTNTFPTFNQNTTGSAAKWTSPITINLSGVTATGQSIDGSGNVTIPVTVVPTSLFTGTLAAGQFPALTGDITNSAGSLATTLKNTGTAGTYGQVTTDAQGRVTSGTIINPIATGGTGSATQNFVDISTNQSSLGGVKTWTGQHVFNSAVTASSGSAIGINANPVLTAATNNDLAIPIDINPTYSGFGAITTFGSITGGSSYTNGTYNGVALVDNTGNGFGATANITVSGGAVTAVAIVNGGNQYRTTANQSVMTATAATIGGTGSGFTVPVTAINLTGTQIVGLRVKSGMSYFTVAGTVGGGTGSITLHASATPTANNWFLRSDGTSTYFNAPVSTGSLFFRIANSTAATIFPTTGNMAVGVLGTASTDNTTDKLQVSGGTISSGLAGTTLGGLKLSGNASGTIAILPQAAAGSYNFNLPNSVGTAGQVLTSQAGGSTAMTWSNVPLNQASANLTAQTAAGNITTFTVGAATATFNVSAYINVTAVATDVIQAQITYTDENNTSQTVSFTTLNSVTNSTYNPITIRAKNATVITLKTNLTVGAGSITFDAGGAIIQN